MSWKWKLLVAVAILLLLVQCARADPPKPDLVMRQGDVVHRLHDRPCIDPEVLQHFTLRALAAGPRAAVLTWADGKDWSSCWIEVDEWIISIDSAGDPLSENGHTPGIRRSLYHEETL